MKLIELIDRAPWREAVTFQHTWPHEYVLLQKDDQRKLFEAVCERLSNGEGVPCRFFAMHTNSCSSVITSLALCCNMQALLRRTALSNSSECATRAKSTASHIHTKGNLRFYGNSNRS